MWMPACWAVASMCASAGQARAVRSPWLLLGHAAVKSATSLHHSVTIIVQPDSKSSTCAAFNLTPAACKQLARCDMHDTNSGISDAQAIHSSQDTPDLLSVCPRVVCGGVQVLTAGRAAAAAAGTPAPDAQCCAGLPA